MSSKKGKLKQLRGSKEDRLKQLALLVEKAKDIPVDPVWTRMGRALGESVLEDLQPYLAASGTTDHWNLRGLPQNELLPEERD